MNGFNEENQVLNNSVEEKKDGGNDLQLDFLPVGSVVLLENASKRVMITGYSCKSPDTGEQIFDYSGCLYPEGFHDYNQVCVFNHSQIKDLYALGFIDEEFKVFQEKYSAELEKFKKGVQSSTN